MKSFLCFLMLFCPPVFATSEITIISPKNEETIFYKDEPIIIKFYSNLQESSIDKYLLIYDEKETNLEQKDGVFYLSSVDRGEHHIQIEMKDNIKNKIIAQSSRIKFFMHKAFI